MKDVILRATGLSKSFAADGVQTHVLGNIDMVLYEGDWTAIMGPSGSGKSTFCIACREWTDPHLAKFDSATKQ